MKFYLLFIALLSFITYGQSPIMSVQTSEDLHFIQKNAQHLMKGSTALEKRIPIVKMHDDIFISFVGKLKEKDRDISAVDGVIIGKGSGKIRSVRISLDKLNAIASIDELEYLELARKASPLLDKENYDTRADSVHAGLDLPRSYTGKNVLLGIQDWGFDYTHPMFYDTLLQHSRILAAWDQWSETGPHPSGYQYGTEYTSWEDLSTAKSDTSNQYGYGTHGTHVAGIAGGSGAQTISKGMAFEAEFLFTTPHLDEASMIDSWNWLYEKSIEYNKNLVVNMSWGLYHQGTLDGSSLLSKAITEYTDLGVLFVSSAGNNGNVNFHFKREFNNDSIRSKIDFYNYALHDSMWGQSIHGWGEIGQNFEVKLEVRTTSQNLLKETPYFSTLMNSYQEGFFMLNNEEDTIWYNISAQESHPQNGKPTVRFRVKNTNSAYNIILVARAAQGTVHFWNVTEVTFGGGNWGMPFSSLGNGYIGGDNLYGTSEPTMADDCLSVASHIATHVSHGYTIGGNRNSFSSIGPRIDGVIKPDISGPGSNVVSSMSSFTTVSFGAVDSTHFQNRTYYYAKQSGTSMSSPAVAGICALVWEVNPYLSPRQVKEIIISTARLDDKTGAIPSEGDIRWGHGKVDAMAAVKAAINFIGVNEFEGNDKGWEVFPNPAHATISITNFEDLQAVQMIATNGRITSLNPYKTTWNVEGFATGIYIFRIVADQRVYQKKIILY